MGSTWRARILETAWLTWCLWSGVEVWSHVARMIIGEV